MRATGHFGDDTAEPHMLIDAGRHFVREQFSSANNTNTGFIAGCLDTQDEWLAHPSSISGDTEAARWPPYDVHARHIRPRPFRRPLLGSGRCRHIGPGPTTV